VCLSGFQFPFSFQLRRVSKKPSAARSIAFRVLYRASQALDAGSIPAARSRLVSYAPQIEILKRSSLCITHAGLNTVLESLSSGMPMVALPITNDQPGVAARIADKKVGVVISPDQASPGNFVAAINRVLGDSTVRNNVQRVQEAIRSADGLSIAAGILETAFELEESQQGVA
jgi:UDP:flavonoid glycosyltransferase YjiC (YdhE family)